MRNNQEISILEELYHGNINPSAKTVVSGSEYQKSQHKLGDLLEELEKLLNTEEKELLENIMTAWSELDCISSEERFTEGFKLGARISLEIFEKDDRQFKPITD